METAGSIDTVGSRGTVTESGAAQTALAAGAAALPSQSMGEWVGGSRCCDDVLGGGKTIGGTGKGLIAERGGDGSGGACSWAPAFLSS